MKLHADVLLLRRWHDSAAGAWVRRHRQLFRLVGPLAFGLVAIGVLSKNNVFATVAFAFSIVGLITAFILFAAAVEDER